MTSTVTHHWHHKIPKHVGGTDHPENLVLLSIEEHAAAHKLLFEMYGRWQDECAYKLLSNLITTEEARYIACEKGKDEARKDPQWQKRQAEKVSKSLREYFANGGSVWNSGRLLKDHPSDDRLKRLSEASKKQAANGNFNCVGDWARGKSFSVEHKANLSRRAQARPRTVCEHCGKDAQPGMFKRWHGDKCKMRVS